MSTIWKTDTEQLGESGGNSEFRSEYEMETFLMLHPEIVGCAGEEDEDPTLWQQIHIEKKYKKNGRIDMVGIAEKKSEGSSGEKVLTIFELKNGEIDTKAIEQLFGYMDEIKKKDKPARKNIGDLLRAKQGYSDKEIEVLIKKAKGVLVGTVFKYDAKGIENNIKTIRDEGYDVVKLTRFKDRSNSNQYTIVEDMVGEVIKSNKAVKNFSWDELETQGEWQLAQQVPDNYKPSISNVKRFIEKGYYKEFKKLSDDIEGLEMSEFKLSYPRFELRYYGRLIKELYLYGNHPFPEKVTAELEKKNIGDMKKETINKIEKRLQKILDS